MVYGLEEGGRPGRGGMHTLLALGGSLCWSLGRLWDLSGVLNLAPEFNCAVQWGVAVRKHDAVRVCVYVRDLCVHGARMDASTSTLRASLKCYVIGK